VKDTNEVLGEIYSRIQSESDIVFPEFGFKRSGNGWKATQGDINGDKAKDHLYHYEFSLLF